jgi:hypothetical protein
MPGPRLRGQILLKPIIAQAGWWSRGGRTPDLLNAIQEKHARLAEIQNIPRQSVSFRSFMFWQAGPIGEYARVNWRKRSVEVVEIAELTLRGRAIGPSLTS